MSYDYLVWLFSAKLISSVLNCICNINIKGLGTEGGFFNIVTRLNTCAQTRYATGLLREW